MTDLPYKTAYLSLAIPLSGDLLSVQQEICQQYALVPRSEVHLTLAFFGEVTARQLVDLAGSLLDHLPSPATSLIRIDGVGGAYETGGELTLIRDQGPDDLKECPRVLWLAASPRDEVHAFRHRAIDAAKTIGVNTTFIGPDFFPHLTLGSAGPADRGNWALWDVHTVPKRATINAQLSSVHLLRLFPE